MSMAQDLMSETIYMTFDLDLQMNVTCKWTWPWPSDKLDLDKPGKKLNIGKESDSWYI